MSNEDDPDKFAFATESISYKEAKTDDFGGFEESRSLLTGRSTVSEGEYAVRLFLEGETTDLRDRLIHAALDAGLSGEELDVLSDVLSEISIETMEVVASMNARQAEELGIDLKTFSKMIDDPKWDRDL